MSSHLFEIRDLKLSYDGGKSIVFELSNLEVPRGKIVFLLGSSGSGKSTLLEFLGMMNNTRHSGDVSFTPDDSTTISYSESWNGSSLKLSSLRKDYFSFIFQNTNLMENFTAYENVCVSGMIQDGNTLSDSAQKAVPLMERMGLPLSEVDFTKMAINLSGGQRQRVAFVRALNTDFKVLFGDEPTGNLDQANADELMISIKEAIGHDRSAVIVSHDINLAIKHADIIFCLSKRDSVGGIVPENVFERKSWENLDRDTRDNFVEGIASMYSLETGVKQKSASELLEKRKHNVKFSSLFWANESRTLRGKSLVNLLILSFIFFITLLAIGFTNGSMAFLKQKSSDPFVNWVVTEVSWRQPREFVDRLRNEITGNAAIRSKFEIQTATTFHIQPLWFFGRKSSEPVRARGRTIEFEGNMLDPVMSSILREENIVNGMKQGYSNPKAMGIIITETLLHELGEDSKSGFVSLAFDKTGDLLTKYSVPVPIHAIVKSLPGKMEVAFSNGFLKVWDDQYGSFNLKSNNSFYLHLNESSAEVAESVKLVISDYCKTHRENEPQLISMERYEESWVGGVVYNINFGEAIDDNSWLNDFLLGIINSNELKLYKNNIHRIYNLNEKEGVNIGRKYDMMSINFLKLDSIRAFQRYLTGYDKGGSKDASFELDVSQVMEKENFTIISNVLGITIYILIIFSVVSITLFLSNLLKMHLEKVKMNIGTFLAFGLEQKKVTSIYIGLILWFLFVSILIGFSFAYSFGFVAEKVFARNLVLAKDVDLFNLFLPNTYYTIGLVLVIAALRSWFIIRKLLAKPPGDLIYNR